MWPLTHIRGYAQYITNGVNIVVIISLKFIVFEALIWKYKYITGEYQTKEIFGDQFEKNLLVETCEIKKHST